MKKLLEIEAKEESELLSENVEQHFDQLAQEFTALRENEDRYEIQLQKLLKIMRLVEIQRMADDIDEDDWGF